MIPRHILRRLRALPALAAATAVLVGSITATASGGPTAPTQKSATPPVNVTVFSPREGDIAGRESRGFFVDLALRYPSVASSGANFQLTGPGTHQNQAPFPGAFAPGVDEKLPGLIVLLSTSTVGARSAQNLANLFNLTGFTNQKTNEIWDTWLVGASSSARTSTRCYESPSPPTRTRTASTTTHQRSSPTRTATAASTPSTSRPTGSLPTSRSSPSRSATERARLAMGLPPGGPIATATT